MHNLASVQAYMREQRIDGWLVYDFRGSNAVFAQLLPGKKWTTRRAILFIPAGGEPILLEHGIDSPSFDTLKVSVRRERYLTWRDFQAWIAGRTASHARIAMEYAPGGSLPVVSMVDSGTVELVRSLGAEVVSSANLVQTCVALWSAAAHENHGVASEKVGRIKDSAFALIGRRLGANQPVNEYEVQQHIMGEFKAAGLQTDEPPIVAVNAHSGNPHYAPSEQQHAPVRRGDWVLIDLWARVPGDENIYSDITWVGFAGRDVPDQHRRVFEVVKAARDAALKAAQGAWSAGRPIQGWQLDDAARETIVKAGFEHGLRHRTGHSLSPGPLVHGLGMNLDNLETHDTREMLPGIGFTIEPGVYLPEFGVRSEINVFVDPKEGPVLTSGIQAEVLAVE